MKKRLPIGTIIKIKDKEGTLMIVGYCSKFKIKKLMAYSYFCCLYPIGFTTSEDLILIKNNEISEVIHIGYGSEKLKKMNKVIEAITEAGG